jgi:mono/diheme cytochrome c family protein
LLLGFSSVCSLALAPPQYGDPRRGADLFQKHHCTACHSIRGVGGGGAAPDLGQPTVKPFTAASLAAVMWNHAPAMWKAMAAKNLEVPALGQGEIADLYAFFYAQRYFEPPGDAARGKQVLIQKRCSFCHTPEKVAKWPALTDPVRWAQNMWNHSGLMVKEMEKKKIPWPQLTAQEMVDLMVYAANLPGARIAPPTLASADPALGEKLFQQQGCARCHSLGKEPGRIDLLSKSIGAKTATEFAAAMWNHGPQMRRRSERSMSDILPFQEEEMRHLLAYLFSKRYFDEPGSTSRGRRLHESRHCGTCHDLKSKGIAFSATQMASALWRHGPKMQAEMEKKGIRWPVFTGRDMADLVAYLQSTEPRP